jgi:hypothetical protein
MRTDPYSRRLGRRALSQWLSRCTNAACSAGASGRKRSAQASPRARRPRSDPEAYWRAWLSALEAILGRTQLAAGDDLHRLQDAWRRAAERTPHGEPVELAPGA